MQSKATTICALWVALRKESVDRNFPLAAAGFADFASLSARRAWIEIAIISAQARAFDVALRKESVDRNGGVAFLGADLAGRSPQGERG